MSGASPVPDVARIDALARQLALTPHELLALTGVLANRPDALLDAERLAQALACLRQAPQAAAAAADLLLLGCGAYVLDDVDRVLPLLWSSPDPDRG
ncbi:MAG: hypothetical protein IT467_05815 [Dokdonella sp.]|uniref:hypothetical protein n=1 Tax=Dokdonella sp. TaxID=2291710 RepID=UPI0025BA85C8|nr:hypothetical protein [Dokdonella sp.]MBZ0222017.1 hypothetical protein [Dokdonella sp.]MCC7255434.1 hypothetical protein [Dokdonella sp.]